MIKQYYLAHPRAHKKEIRKWQKEFEKQFPNIKLLNPFVINKYHENSINHKLLVENDINLIKKSDGMIAIVDDKNTIGTHMEIVYAYFMEKPIYVVALTNYVEEHSWIYYHATKIFSTKGELVEWFKNRNKEKVVYKSKPMKIRWWKNDKL